MSLKDLARSIYYRFESNTEIIIMTDEEMDNRAKPYLKKIAGNNRIVKSDNIKSVNNMQMRAAARECVIKELTESAEYSVDRPLVVMNPFGYVPMSAMAIFHTDKPCKTTMWVQSRKDTRIVGTTPKSCNHRVPIIGCYAGTTNNIYIKLEWNRFHTKTLKFSIDMDPVPEEMKGMVKILKKDDKPAYPFYYVSGVDSWFPYIFDCRGHIRYYITKPGKNYGVFPMSGGMLLHSDRGILTPGFGVPHSTYVHEMDLLGRIRRTLHIDKGHHHDAVEMVPGGNYLVATSTLDRYCEDVVAEIDRKTGLIVKSIEMDSVVNDEAVKDSPDWAHLNTVSYNPADNSVIVCLRNLHSIIKLDWETDEIKWMLGDPGFWKDSPMAKYLLKPEGDVKWFYQAHSSFQIAAEPGDNPDIVKIAIYDNHWQSRRQTDNFDNDENSYGIIYEVNEKKHTVVMRQRFESLKSSVRSNIVYDKSIDRVMLMSGCLNKKYKGCRGILYDYRLSDGKLLNVYGVSKQFYRAYPYKFDYNSIAEPVPYDDSEFGYLSGPVKIDTIDVTDAKELPPSDRPDTENPEPSRVPEFPKRGMKTRSEKEAEWEAMTRGRTWAELDHTGRIGRTTFKLTGNMLFLYAVDHIVSYLYIVGNNNTYMVDYTGTRQDIPALFYNYSYHIAVPLDNLEDDNYKLYVKCFDTLYDTGSSFEIKRQEDHDE